MSRVPKTSMALVLAAAIAVAGCGSSSSGGGTQAGVGGTSSGYDLSGKKGGTLTVKEAQGGVDSLDPGYWYYQTDNTDLSLPAERELYGWPPKATSPVPDLAQGMPQASAGGKTLTIKLKPGIHYSPPYQTHTVTSSDI